MKHKISFVIGYSEKDTWGAGLANVMAVTYNSLILAGAFIITRVFIVTALFKEFKNLNKK